MLAGRYVAETDDLEVLVAIATRAQRRFAVQGNLTFFCSEDGGHGWVPGSPQADLRGEEYNVAHLVVRCPRSGYVVARTGPCQVRVRRQPAPWLRTRKEVPLDDNVAAPCELWLSWNAPAAMPR